MPKISKTYYAVFLGLFFLALGIFSSPTIVSGYHILIFIPMLVLFFRGERIELKPSMYILLALFVWGILCTSLNFEELIKPHKSFQELKYYLFGVLCIVPLKYFLDRAPDRHIKFLISTLCVVLIIGFFAGISKAYFGFDIVKWKVGEFKNRSGGFLNYMRYGYGSAFLFLLGWAMLLKGQGFRKWINPKLFYPALLCCFLAIFAAKTRGALLAVLVGLPFFYLKYKPKIAGSIIAIGAVFAGVIIYFSFITNKPAPSRFLNINDGSNTKRMSQFYTATKAISERPVFGWGADQFSYHVPALKEKYDVWSKDYAGHSHNIFLEHAVSYGIVGALLLGAFFGLWFFEMFQLKSEFGWAICTYIIAFVVGGQVELLFDNLNSHLLFFIYSLSQVSNRLKPGHSIA